MAEDPRGAKESAADAATAPSPRVRPSAKPGKTKPLPPHVVFLHNDPHNSMEFVVRVLRKVLGLERSQAIRFMVVAHKRGRCAVWSGHKELAELKAAQITAAGPDPVAVLHNKRAPPLKTTVEPAPGA